MRNGGHGPGPKHVGTLYLLALVLTLSGALLLAWYFHSGRAAMTATLLPTPAPAYLSWKAFQHDRADAHPTADPAPCTR
ncbi:hypothetical protein [Streptomyces sp. NPDC001480]|uniref:hypothetical protein n=1 Tax=Streptomyces sp. NPDC001480 TaxID=3364577 RepID=UPI0036A819A2